MTQKEALRLARVEDRQTEMTQQVAELRADMKANTKVTNSINAKLDNLTGGKQALMWVLAFIVSVGVIIATLVGSHK